jgi:hypothetical protein
MDDRLGEVFSVEDDLEPWGRPPGRQESVDRPLEGRTGIAVVGV